MISHFALVLIVQMMTTTMITTMTTVTDIAMDMTTGMETLLQKENLCSQIGLFKSWFQAVSYL